jgi:hypothetical protein
MSNRNACLLMTAVLLATLSAAAQNRDPSDQEMEQLVQQRTANLRKTQTAEKAYLEKLNSAIRGGPADQRGSNDQKQKLRETISKAGPGLQRSLSGLDCRDRRCKLDFKLSQGVSGEARARELFAIDEWAAWSQPCAYTMAHEPVSGALVQVFIDCTP